MQQLDLQVIDKALEWLADGHDLWFCTVMSTYGSAPRAPGALLVARADSAYAGSLSGGCVEEEFLASLAQGDLQAPAQLVRYGETDDDRRRLRLPCGGVLQVLVEHHRPSEPWREHLLTFRAALQGQRRLLRRVNLTTGDAQLLPDPGGQQTRIHDEQAEIRVGPALRLLLAGVSPVAQACAAFARSLGCEVIACDPREEMQGMLIEGVEVQPVLPSVFIEAGGCHEATAVVALTHDPRIDDLALMEAVRTPAFYIGAMGSLQTSVKRAERLQRVGGLNAEQIERIHMPIGLDLGSKTPAEIALSVMADVLRVYRGKPRESL